MPALFLESRMPAESRLRTVIAWVALWLTLACGNAWAQDHITARGWVEDPSAALTLEQVRQLPFRPYQGILSRGFGSAALWLQLRVDPSVRTSSGKYPERLVLRIRPLYLDDVRVYDPLAPHGLAGVTGDRHHPRNAELGGQDFLLPIARGTEPRDIWVRVASTSTRQVDVQALNTDDLARQSSWQQLAFSTYVGLMVILALWGLTYWLFSREVVIGAFGVLQASALLFALASLGFARALWPDAWPAEWLDMLASVASISAVSAGILFHTLLLREFSPPRWIQRVQWAQLGLYPVKLLALPWLPQETLTLNMLEVLATPFVMLLAALLATGWSQGPERKRPALARPVVVGFYMLLLGVLAVAAVPGLGLSAGGEVPLYLVQAHGLITAFLILVMLQYRAHVMNRRQRDTALALERSELQARQEREIRQEQEKLLAMLAHELKTPLATMHLRLDAAASGSREIRQAMRDMDGVIERCLQTARLGDRQLVAHRTAVDVAALVRDAASSCSHPGRVQLHLPPRWVMHTDRQLLFIVLNNLLENACKYAAPDTPIEVRLSPADPEAAAGGGARADAGLRVEIANPPGPAGWPDTAQVFSKYYRSPHARRQAGTGLGLYLVRSVMHTLGGAITYAPDASKVRFVLELPEMRAA